MYIDRIVKYHKGKKYTTVLIRISYREKGKIKHETIANISSLPESLIQKIETLVKNPETSLQKIDSLKIMQSREYGASFALISLIRNLELDKIIYSQKEQWRQDVIAMIIGRIVYQGSKLHLTQLHKDSALWTLTGFTGQDCPDVEEHCYKPLDRLLERQEAIQKQLAKKHLKNGTLVLYDITSSYFEGEYEESELVTFGHSRDKKRGYEQIVIGLLANEFGCPFSIKVFKGNTSDQTTVLERAEKIFYDYEIKDVIFVGDRGMLTSPRISEVNNLGYKTLTVLNRDQMQELLDRGVINSNQFKKDVATEISDPKNPSIRYFLCKNPDKEVENRYTRNCLIVKTRKLLKEMADKKSLQDVQKKSARVGKFLNKFKVGKFFNWKFIDNKLTFQIDSKKIIDETVFDGCFIIRTDSNLKKENAVKGYKMLTFVERAFRSMKTMSIEIRPVYHHLDKRIESHVFLCMLAYYVEWHAIQLLQPLLAQDGRGSKKRFSFERIILRLRTIMIQDCFLKDVKISGVITAPDAEQERILTLLNCSQNHKI